MRSVAIRTGGKISSDDLAARLEKSTNLRTIVGRRVSLLFANLHMNGLADPELHKRILGFDFQYKNYLSVQDSNSDFYYVFYDTASAKAEAEMIRQRGKGLAFAKRVIENSVAAGTEAVEFAKAVEAMDLAKQSKTGLLKLFGSYVEKICALMPITVITAAAELNVEEQLKMGLEKKVKGKKELEAAMIRLTAPDRYNVPYEEQISLLKLAKSLKGGTKAGKELEEHWKRYSWLGYRFDFGEPWTKKEILYRAKEVADPEGQLRFLEKKEAAVKMEFADTVKRLKLGEELVDEANAAREFVWLRTYRTDAINEALGRAKALIDEIGKRYKLPYGYAHYLTIDEIRYGKIPKNGEIEARMESYALAFIGTEGYLLSGDNAGGVTDFAKASLMGLKDGKKTGIKGMVANRPVESIEGIARVVNSVEDVAKVKAGEILIAPMTEPNFVPAMERASAFVTDEGGLLCHAAIISREMNKPCIIGTGTGTKSIRNGDTVRLNLVDGSVHVIGAEEDL